MSELSNEDFIATLLDAAEVEGPGTMGALLMEAADRLEAFVKISVEGNK